MVVVSKNPLLLRKMEGLISPPSFIAGAERGGSSASYAGTWPLLNPAGISNAEAGAWATAARDQGFGKLGSGDGEPASAPAALAFIVCHAAAPDIDPEETTRGEAAGPILGAGSTTGEAALKISFLLPLLVMREPETEKSLDVVDGGM